MIGPVYIAHPYTGDTADNVELAAELSTVVNSLCVATISPLQESRGREPAFNERGWLKHGLVLLRSCKAIVLPNYWRESSGCRSEMDLAAELAIPAFLAERVDCRWVLRRDFFDWVDALHREKVKL